MQVSAMTMPDPPDISEEWQACISQLIDAANDWERRGMVDAPLLVGCATPNAGLIVSAKGWPANTDNGGHSQRAIAAALAAAVETPTTKQSCGMALIAVSLLLGEAGRAEHREAVARIRGKNEIPILSMLIADGEVAAFTVGVARPVLH
jgi:hypothetical protein